MCPFKGKRILESSINGWLKSHLRVSVLLLLANHRPLVGEILVNLILDKHILGQRETMTAMTPHLILSSISLSVCLVTGNLIGLLKIAKKNFCRIIQILDSLHNIK